MENIIKYLDNAASFHVLVVGESIIDQYHHCFAMGKSAKDPILVAKYLHSEQSDGGILAVARHLADFCPSVDVLTSNPIIKRRFIESYSLQKLLQVDEFTEQSIDCDKLCRILPEYDLVIVIDYGHGMLNEEAIDMLCDVSPFLAVNTQANAANWGLNTISKYLNANYVTLARHEIELEERANGNVRQMVANLWKRCDYDTIAVTCGKDGSVLYNGEFAEVPAFTQLPVDRTGAGDAFLSISALCAVQGIPLDIVGLVGNAAGAIACGYLGNKESVTKEKLYQFIEGLE